MAVGETAKLIASLELQDKFSKTASSAERALGGLETKATTLGRVGGEVGRGLGNVARNVATIGAFGAGFLAVQIGAGVKSLADLEAVEAQTRAVLESTKGAAGVTAAEVRKLAEEFENLNATMDDKVIQSAENLLLTFTNIDQRAFKPALQAALDMNQAMGGGEEGLQSTIIQLGKALQDPIRGATALRRVGVNLTEQQQAQIKTLVEQNDLYGAQQIVLKELSTEFSGSFAAAGDTAAGKFAKVQDAIEGAQQSIARAFLPVLGRAADKLNTFLSDPKVLAGIEDFGGSLAGGFEQAVEFAGKIPWGTIGSSLQIAGAGAKAVLSAFTALPEWVQTAVITGWGLNKLSGGALGNIVGALGSGLIKGVLGMNAGVVNINAGVVNGGGGGVPPVGGGGFLGGLARGLGTGAVVGGAAALAGIAAVEVVNFGNMREEAITGLEGQLDTMPRRTGAEIDASIARIEQTIQSQTDESVPFWEQIIFNTNVRPQLDQELAELRKLQDHTKSVEHSASSHASDARAAALHASSNQINEFRRASNERRAESNRTASLTARVAEHVSEARRATQTGFSATAERLGTSNARLATIAGKNFSPTVRVNVTSSVSISEVQRKIISSQIAIGRGFLEGTG